MKKICPECYSGDRRITPLLEPRHCLENHLQYICSTCGRCICIERDKKRGLQRWNFPFKTLETAKLYLRTADITTGKACGVYEAVGSNGRKSYKIFADKDDFADYLKKNRGKQCKQTTPLFIQDSDVESLAAQIRRLSQDEVEKYIQEQLNEKIILKKLKSF